MSADRGASGEPTHGPVSYGRRVAQLAERHPDRIAVVLADHAGTEHAVSWRELDERATQFALTLDRLSIDEGSVVVVALPNSVEHFVATHGAWKAGASVLPLRWDLPDWERDRILEVARPDAVVADWTSIEVPVPLLARGDIGAAPVGAPERLDDRVPRHSRMITTSGSTGTPKLIVSPAPGVYDPDAPVSPMYRLGEDVVQLVTSPLYHTNGFICHSKLLSGAQLVVMEKFDAQRAVDLVESWRPNHVILVPTMLQRIAALPEVDRRDLSSLEWVFYGGASLSPGVARRWLELVGPEHFFFQYGGSEALGGTMASGVEWLERPGTVGRAVNCELRIADDDGNELATGEVGNIMLRSHAPGPTFEYIGAPTPAATADGFRTYGDLGWLDDDGYLFIADRRVDMIVTGGANVFPAEVECALVDHPDVADVVVIGLPDDEWGHRVHAIVEPAGADHELDAEGLRSYLKERIAAYKVPKSFEFLEAMPRTSAGKINRSRLVDDRSASSTRSP